MGPACCPVMTESLLFTGKNRVLRRNENSMWICTVKREGNMKDINLMITIIKNRIHIYLHGVASCVVFTAICVWMAASQPVLAEPMVGKPPLKMITWGGAYAGSQMRAYVRPYRQNRKQWVTVEEFSGGLAEIRSQVLSLNVKWDLVDIGLADAVRACKEGLLENIDPDILPPAADGTPAIEDFYEGTLRKCAVGQNIWSTVFAYNPSRFSGKKPDKLADFFDVKKFPGLRGLRLTPRVNLEWALMADGVPAAKVYPVLSTDAGVKRAFNKLDKIKGHIVWWEKGSEPPQMLSSGRAVMSSAWNGRIFSAKQNRGGNSTIVWDGQVWDLEVWVIPKGTENLKEALDFIGFASDPRRMAEQAKLIAYGPARKSAMALVSEDVRNQLPTAKENKRNALQFDFKWWSENGAAMEVRFSKWLKTGARRYKFNAPDSP
jgi:putative spermidine/putrescine transport system substrate-binding protein